MTPVPISVRIHGKVALNRGKRIKRKKRFNDTRDRTRINEAIRVPELRVIDADGSQAGVMNTRDALELARNQELDLIEVSPNATPPVARIANYGKYKYEKTKQAQKNKKNQVKSDLKQIRMGLKIGDHDLDIKVKKIREFLEDGHKVKISAFFRGREMAHKEIGHQLLDKVVSKIDDIAIVETEKPVFAGRHLSIQVRRGSSAKTKDAQRREEES